MKTQKTNNFKANVLTVEQMVNLKGGGEPTSPALPPTTNNNEPGQ